MSTEISSTSSTFFCSDDISSSNPFLSFYDFLNKNDILIHHFKNGYITFNDGNLYISQLENGKYEALINIFYQKYLDSFYATEKNMKNEQSYDKYLELFRMLTCLVCIGHRYFHLDNDKNYQFNIFFKNFTHMCEAAINHALYSISSFIINTKHVSNSRENILKMMYTHLFLKISQYNLILNFWNFKINNNTPIELMTKSFFYSIYFSYLVHSNSFRDTQFRTNCNCLHSSVNFINDCASFISNGDMFAFKIYSFLISPPAYINIEYVPSSGDVFQFIAQCEKFSEEHKAEISFKSLESFWELYCNSVNAAFQSGSNDSINIKKLLSSYIYLSIKLESNLDVLRKLMEIVRAYINRNKFTTDSFDFKTENLPSRLIKRIENIKTCLDNFLLSKVTVLEIFTLSVIEQLMRIYRKDPISWSHLKSIITEYFDSKMIRTFDDIGFYNFSLMFISFSTQSIPIAESLCPEYFSRLEWVTANSVTNSHMLRLLSYGYFCMFVVYKEHKIDVNNIGQILLGLIAKSTNSFVTSVNTADISTIYELDFIGGYLEAFQDTLVYNIDQTSFFMEHFVNILPSILSYNRPKLIESVINIYESILNLFGLQPHMVSQKDRINIVIEIFRQIEKLLYTKNGTHFSSFLSSIAISGFKHLLSNMSSYTSEDAQINDWLNRIGLSSFVSPKFISEFWLKFLISDVLLKYAVKTSLQSKIIQFWIESSSDFPISCFSHFTTCLKFLPEFVTIVPEDHKGWNEPIKIIGIFMDQIQIVYESSSEDDKNNLRRKINIYFNKFQKKIEICLKSGTPEMLRKLYSFTGKMVSSFPRLLYNTSSPSCLLPYIYDIMIVPINQQSIHSSDKLIKWQLTFLDQFLFGLSGLDFEHDSYVIRKLNQITAKYFYKTTLAHYTEASQSNPFIDAFKLTFLQEVDTVQISFRKTLLATISIHCNERIDNLEHIAAMAKFLWSISIKTTNPLVITQSFPHMLPLFLTVLLSFYQSPISSNTEYVYINDKCMELWKLCYDLASKVHEFNMVNSLQELFLSFAKTYFESHMANTLDVFIFISKVDRPNFKWLLDWMNSLPSSLDLHLSGEQTDTMTRKLLEL